MNDSLAKIGLDLMFEVSDEMREKTMWMEEEILAPAITDFFYKKPIDYQKNSKSFKSEDLF
jgi:ribonucleotide reductase beta subunit family protein with ferritin-like domain